MPFPDLLWVFVYPLSVIVIVVFRIITANQQSSVYGAHPKEAPEATYWGRYAPPADVIEKKAS